MIPKDDSLEKAVELRRLAKEIARHKAHPTAADRVPLTPEEAQLALHELSVHQIELELQNEELRRAQAELDLTRARYFDLYDLAPVGYCTLSPKGLVLEANLTALNLLGETRGGLLQQPITRFIHKDDQDLYYLHRRELFAQGESLGWDLRMIRADGSLFWARLMATLTLDPDQDPGTRAPGQTGSRLVLTDITERKRAEEENAKLEAQLRQTQNLETLGVLAGGVAHDFNNLLTTILGNANLGSLAVAPESTLGLYFLAIEKAALRAADLTRQLLAYAGKGKFVLTDVNLGMVVQELLALRAAAIPETVALQCELAEPLPLVRGDVTQLFQLLMNLITNATEAFPDGEGQLLLKTRTEDVTLETLAAGCWPLPFAPGPAVTLEVTDDGAGMPPEVLQRAFEPFYSTKFTGRGLGLAVVLGILRSHGGGIQVTTEPGRGSTFKVFLPALPTAVPLPASTGPAWRGSGGLLLVEHEGEVRHMARAMAESLGFTVREAASGPEAVEAFRGHHGNLALVILDLSMPVMDGQAVALVLRKIDSGVPVVLSSGYELDEDDLVAEGLAGFLKKPYRLAEFRNLLQRILEPKGD